MNPPGYIEIPGGDYVIGLDDVAIAGIPESFLESVGLRRRYLYHSSPAHMVTLASFSMAERPVSAAEFARFTETSGYLTEAERDGWGWVWEGGWKKRGNVSFRRPHGNGRDDEYMVLAERFPALQVSWNDADAYCRWAAGYYRIAIRLPLEEEWEVFAGTTGIPSLRELREEIQAPGSGYDSPPVPPMTLNSPYPPGRVWEWTQNWFDRYPGGRESREFGLTYKVLRGGSLLSRDIQRSREYRFRRCPTARSPYYGFRTAASI